MHGLRSLTLKKLSENFRIEEQLHLWMVYSFEYRFGAILDVNSALLFGKSLMV